MDRAQKDVRWSKGLPWGPRGSILPPHALSAQGGKGNSYPLALVTHWVKGSPGGFRFPPLLPPPALKDPTRAALVGGLFLSKGQQILGETLLCQFYAWHRGSGREGGMWVNRTGKAPPSWSLFLGEGTKDKKGDKLKVGD